MFSSSPSPMMQIAQDILDERRADADRVRLLDRARPPGGAFARLFGARNRPSDSHPIAARPPVLGGAPCCAGAA